MRQRQSGSCTPSRGLGCARESLPSITLQGRAGIEGSVEADEVPAARVEGPRSAGPSTAHPSLHNLARAGIHEAKQLFQSANGQASHGVPDAGWAGAIGSGLAGVLAVPPRTKHQGPAGEGLSASVSIRSSQSRPKPLTRLQL
jgi:hypothetical protein